jgi:hypothetical protein
MRFIGKSRLGFYPLPSSVAFQIRRHLLYRHLPSSALDPCVGDGVAFEAITSGAEVLRYGIELAPSKPGSGFPPSSREIRLKCNALSSASASYI